MDRKLVPQSLVRSPPGCQIAFPVGEWCKARASRDQHRWTVSCLFSEGIDQHNDIAGLGDSMGPFYPVFH